MFYYLEVISSIYDVELLKIIFQNNIFITERIQMRIYIKFTDCIFYFYESKIYKFSFSSAKNALQRKSFSPFITRQLKIFRFLQTLSLYKQQDISHLFHNPTHSELDEKANHCFLLILKEE